MSKERSLHIIDYLEYFTEMFSELDKRNNCKHGQSAQILLRNCRRNNEQDELGET